VTDLADVAVVPDVVVVVDAAEVEDVAEFAALAAGAESSFFNEIVSVSPGWTRRVGDSAPLSAM
jgi:hypothetical protein